MKKISVEEIKKIGNIGFLSKYIVEGFISGLHKSPYHGFSVEFVEHVAYNQSDDVKNIDWKIFAKTDKLYKKKFEEETNLRCTIVLDISTSMYYPEKNFDKLTHSIMSAGCISYLLHRQRDAVGLCTFTNQIEYLSPVKSTRQHLNMIFDKCNQLIDNKLVEVKTKSNVAKILDQVADQIHKRSLIVLFTDMFDQESNIDELLSALQHIKHNGHELIVFHVFDQQTELDFEFEQKPYQFIDLESGSQIKVNPAELKTEYQQSVKNYIEDIKDKCNRYKINFIPIDAGKGYEQALLPFLIQRSKMR